jgi:monoterpene epsilon-lactone hydrolase
MLMLIKSLALGAALLVAAAASAQVPQRPTTQADAPTRDTTFIAPDGTAYITRVIPVPTTVSAEAQKQIGQQFPDTDEPETLVAGRLKSDRTRERLGKVALEKYPAQVMPGVMAGVPVTIVTPNGEREVHSFVLINVHGGALRFDCCSLAESIPIANLMKAEVIAVRYRLAPEHPFPAAVDDVVAVYLEVLKNHRPNDVVIYGTSAGAMITAEVAVKLKALGLPQPAALGIFSGHGDFTRQGDSRSFFTGIGIAGFLTPATSLPDRQRDYAGATRLDDPLLSPMKGELSGLPPTLFLTSTRDFFLSGTSLLHRAMLRSGDDAELVVFEGLGHAFWVSPALPESDEAYHLMVKFFRKHLGKN